MKTIVASAKREKWVVGCYIAGHQELQIDDNTRGEQRALRASCDPKHGLAKSNEKKVSGQRDEWLVVSLVCASHKQHKLHKLFGFELLITDADGQEGVEQIELRRIAVHLPQLRQYYLYYSIWRIRMVIFKILNTNLLAPSFVFPRFDPCNLLHFGGVDKHPTSTYTTTSSGVCNYASTHEAEHLLLHLRS